MAPGARNNAGRAKCPARLCLCVSLCVSLYVVVRPQPSQQQLVLDSEEDLVLLAALQDADAAQVER
jgi:hypothetical protein